MPGIIFRYMILAEDTGQTILTIIKIRILCLVNRLTLTEEMY